MENHVDELDDAEGTICMAILMEMDLYDESRRERAFADRYAWNIEREIVNKHGGRDGRR